MTNHITASPLCWPPGWKRTKNPQTSRFGKWNKPVTIAKATDFVMDQFHLMKVPSSQVILSTNLRLRNNGYPYSNQKQPDDKGVSTWWGSDKEQKVIALDKYDRIADNIWAIGKTLEAMRGIERWGSGEILERVFTGFTALPDPYSSYKSNWRIILGNYSGTDIHELKLIFKKLRSKQHPDNGGDDEIFFAINKAWEQGKQELSQ